MDLLNPPSLDMANFHYQNPHVQPHIHSFDQNESNFITPPPAPFLKAPPPPPSAFLQPPPEEQDIYGHAFAAEGTGTLGPHGSMQSQHHNHHHSQVPHPQHSQVQHQQHSHNFHHPSFPPPGEEHGPFAPLPPAAMTPTSLAPQFPQGLPSEHLSIDKDPLAITDTGLSLGQGHLHNLHKFDCFEDNTANDMRLLMYGFAPGAPLDTSAVGVMMTNELPVAPQVPMPAEPIDAIEPKTVEQTVEPEQLEPQAQQMGSVSASSKSVKSKTLKQKARGKSQRKRNSNASSRDSYSTNMSMESFETSSPATSISSPKKTPRSPASPYQLPRPPTPPAHHCKIVRGIASGGANTHPPEPSQKNMCHLPVELKFGGMVAEQVYKEPWSLGEKLDRRRIVRIERRQRGHVIFVDFSIVGCANEHPKPEPPPPETDVIEVSCLAWEKASDEDEPGTHYYITSVEVVGLVETLIQSKLMEPKLRCRERGRIRSNLLTFWSKASYHSKTKERADGHRAKFARSIMSYEVRKPRGFDKGFRILRWDRLVPALQRALQCYYAEMTKEEMHMYSNMDY